ncbi:hypothetical protein C2G38_2103805 [Gigaspora rosea]|uniref:Uncharacterized protein n=1 Tax=Gigaspora rosea TaxID=44941 RepID=A0A397UM64_9GLOM|nr:hypothetical protein C2G38_2103805 [Gigaspora rosea]
MIYRRNNDSMTILGTFSTVNINSILISCNKNIYFVEEGSLISVDLNLNFYRL